MEKVARRTNVKPSGTSPRGPREVSQLPVTPRGPSRWKILCRQIGFLLVFALCTLFTYYVAVVRLHPPGQARYISNLPFFQHSKHLKQQQSDGADNNPFAFTLPSVDWQARDLSRWFPWRKSGGKGRQETGGNNALELPGMDLKQLGGEKSTGVLGGEKLKETERGGGVGLQRREMEAQSEQGLSQSSRKDWLGKPKSGGEADVALTSAVTSVPAGLDGGKKERSIAKDKDSDLGETERKKDSADTGGDADVVLTSAPLFRGSNKDDRTPVLKRVVAELEKQAEVNKHALKMQAAEELLAQARQKELESGREGEGGNDLAGGAGNSASDGGKAPKRKKRKRRKFNSPQDLYDPISNEGYQPCVERDADWTVPPAVEGRGYFYPGLDGGLSQQVFEITNSVAVARILNVTLVIPQLGFDPYWKDGSNFSTIFDLEHFRKTLADDIRVITVPELPEDMRNEYFWRIIDRIPYGTEDQYVEAFWDSFSTDKVTKSYSFFTALDMDLRPALEKLRCRTKYEALRLHPQIVTTAERLVDRMRQRANGPFLALHLRFETDMVMYSSRCDYGIDDPAEQKYWDEQRKERGWPEPEPEDVMRSQGRCPATPGEVGRWLQAMGFNESTQVYLASGAIYHEDVFLPAFLEMFPNTLRKEDLFTADETALLKGKNNVLAGIDFEVLANADVTALTFHGMMKSSIQGHRSWLGFRKTLLYPLMESGALRDMPWKEFKVAAKKATHLGHPQDRVAVEVMGNPVPDCMCQGR